MSGQSQHQDAGAAKLRRPRLLFAVMTLLAAAALATVAGSWLFLMDIPRMANSGLTWLLSALGFDAWLAEVQPEFTKADHSTGAAAAHDAAGGLVWFLERTAGQGLAAGALSLAALPVLLYALSMLCLWFRLRGSRIVVTGLTLLGAFCALLLLAAGSFAFVVPALFSTAAILLLWFSPCGTWYVEPRRGKRQAPKLPSAQQAGPAPQF